MSKRKKKANPQFPSRIGKTKGDRVARIHYALLIGFLALFVLHALFFQENIIGHDVRYTIYVFFGPTLLGCLALAIYQWKTIRDVFQEVKTVKDYAFAIFLLPLLGLVIAYLTFGNVAEITWTYLNKREADQNMPQVFHCSVDDFTTGKRKSIRYTFEHEYEYFHVTYETIKPYLNTNPRDCEMVITAQKGLWNYYVVKEWYLKKK
ncbi:MAG: hypothetical protein JWM14_1581 [Chitinophagaceae bacterium]|nr:hypothetical protein [Chitinophagaceae bacterium]